MKNMKIGIMRKEIEKQLDYLKLLWLRESWDKEIKSCEEREWSIRKFLNHIVKKEYSEKIERSRLSRIKSAKIPLEYRMETFPFEKQPHLNKKRLLSKYDSLSYIENSTNLIFLGRTGTGKTGLATAFLLNAINNGYRGKFLLFSELIGELWGAQADNTHNRIIAKYSTIPCLVVDEFGYINITAPQASLFFSLMNKRCKKTCTIITSNIGFDDWKKYLKDDQISAALIDRVTEGGHVINFKNCKSLRAEADVD